MDTIARFGRANRLGGVSSVSMSTSPPAVVTIVRAYPGSDGGPGGKVNGIPKTTVVPAPVGVSCTVTTFAALTVTVTGPSGVCTVSGLTTQVSLPGSHAVAALAGAAGTAIRTLAVRLTTSRSSATRRPVRLPGGSAGQFAV